MKVLKVIRGTKDTRVIRDTKGHQELTLVKVLKVM